MNDNKFKSLIQFCRARVGVIAFIVSCVAIYQGYMNKENLEITRLQFNATYRPWVGPTDPLGELVFHSDVIELSIRTKNYGDLPAKNLIYSKKLYDGDKLIKEVMNGFGVLFKNCSTIYTMPIYAKDLNEKSDVTIITCIKYEGQFGNNYETEFETSIYNHWIKIFLEYVSLLKNDPNNPKIKKLYKTLEEKSAVTISKAKIIN